MEQAYSTRWFALCTKQTHLSNLSRGYPRARYDVSRKTPDRQKETPPLREVPEKDVTKKRGVIEKSAPFPLALTSASPPEDSASPTSRRRVPRELINRPKRYSVEALLRSLRRHVLSTHRAQLWLRVVTTYVGWPRIEIIYVSGDGGARCPTSELTTNRIELPSHQETGKKHRPRRSGDPSRGCANQSFWSAITRRSNSPKTGKLPT